MLDIDFLKLAVIGLQYRFEHCLKENSFNLIQQVFL